MRTVAQGECGVLCWGMDRQAMQKAYPSDLHDTERALLEPLIPALKRVLGHPRGGSARSQECPRSGVIAS